MMKEYSISSFRRVCVKQQDDDFFVTIEQPGSELKRVTLPAKRWVALLASELDETLDLLQTQQYVRLNTHIGGGFYVSVTTGYNCVDIRRFYYNPAKDSTLPTKEGIAINLNDWTAFKVIAQQINQDFPQLANAEMCMHQTFIELISCGECHPFDLPTPL